MLIFLFLLMRIILTTNIVMTAISTQLLRSFSFIIRNFVAIFTTVLSNVLLSDAIRYNILILIKMHLH